MSVRALSVASASGAAQTTCSIYQFCSHMCSETPRNHPGVLQACFEPLWAPKLWQSSCLTQHHVQAPCLCAGTLAPAVSNGALLGSRAPTGQASLFSSSAGLGAQSELTTAQLMHAAKMARLSGFTYRPVEDLSDWLSKEGLQLVARGQTHFTRSDPLSTCTTRCPFHQTLSVMGILNIDVVTVGLVHAANPSGA